MKRPLATCAGLLGLSGALLFAANAANAHARLVGAEPAQKAAVASPTSIVLHFSEPLEARLSRFLVKDAAGQMVATKPATAPDAKSMAATPEAPLAAGVYTVSWTAVGDDTHVTKGTYSFSVK